MSGEQQASILGLQNHARVRMAHRVVDSRRNAKNTVVLTMQNSLRMRQAREQVEIKRRSSQQSGKKRRENQEQRPSTVAAPAGGNKQQNSTTSNSTEAISARAKQRVEDRERRDAEKIQGTTDRIFKAQVDSIIQYEEKVRDEIEAEEGKGIQRIKRSEKAHMEFVLVDAERIRREEAPPEPPHHDEGLDLLFNFLKKDRPEDEAQQIHEDRRRRVTSLIEAKKFSEKMGEDLAARKKYTEDIQLEAQRIQRVQAEDLKQHLQEQSEKQNQQTNESVSTLRDTTEAERERRLEKVQEDVNFTRQHGNSRRKIHEAEEKKERSKNLKKQSDWTRRGFLKSPSRSRTASPAGSPSRRPTTVAADPRRSSSSMNQQQINSNSSSAVGGDRNASPESERSLQPFEDENEQRPITVPKKQQEAQQDAAKQGADPEKDRRQGAEEDRFRTMAQKHVEKREEVEKKQEERRRKEREAHEAAVAKSKEIHERRQREREEEKARALNIEEEKNKLRAQISRDGQRRRELEDRETELVNKNLEERVSAVRTKDHPLRAEMRALEEDSRMVKESHKKTTALSKVLTEEERKKNLDLYLQRHTAEASRQAELIAMREQRKEDCSRIWQDKVKAQNERQEVARLQQLMNVKNTAMETKADSLMAREVVVRNKALDALQKQQRVAEQRKKHFVSQAGINGKRKILEQLYSHPPDMTSPPRQTRSALEHRRSSRDSTGDDHGHHDRNHSTTMNSTVGADSSKKRQRHDTLPSAEIQDSYALVSVKRAHTPQPIKVLPDEMRKSKPTLTKPTPALLRTLEAPEELKQKAWRLYSLLEEVREEEKQAFIANIKGSEKSQPRPSSSLNGSSGGGKSLNSTTTNTTTGNSTAKKSTGSHQEVRVAQKSSESEVHGTAEEQQQGHQDDPQEHHHEEKKPWELPKRIKTASDRLTSKSVAQDANNLLRQKQVMNTTIHDDLPKVHTPNRRLYEDPESRANRMAMEQERKEKQNWEQQLGKGKIRDFDGDFAQRFYNDQVSKHQRCLDADRNRALRQSNTNKRKDITLDDEDLMHLVGRLHSKSESKAVKATSAQMNEGKKDDPVRPSPARQRLDQQIIEKLYVEAGERQKKEFTRLDKKYYTTLQEKQQSKTKKMTEEQMEESRERLFRGEIYQD